jgi:hypothetical protein
MGTPLPDPYRALDGRLLTGTEYEFVDALDGNRKNQIPDIFVWRKNSPRMIELGAGKAAEAEAQMAAVATFFDRYFSDPHGSFLAAFNEFTNLEEFERVVEGALKKWIEERLGTHSQGAAPWNHSPFRGLQPFEFEHADVYFGRTQSVNEILNSLRTERETSAAGKQIGAFVLVLGKSGVGKSSFVRAGVLPMLANPRLIEGIDAWRRVVLRPGDGGAGLFGALASGLLRTDALGEELRQLGVTAAELGNDLRQSPIAAIHQLRGALRQVGRSITGNQASTIWLALVIDQLEEIFTQVSISPNERNAFANALGEMATSGFIWVICVCRTDFFSRFSELPVEFNRLRQGPGQYELASATTAEIGQIIRGPAQMAHLQFESEAQSRRSLDEVLLDATAAYSAGLPLLEFTLDELFKRRTPTGLLTFNAYLSMGGIEGAVREHANSVWEAFTEEEKYAFSEVLSLLVGLQLGTTSP